MSNTCVDVRAHNAYTRARCHDIHASGRLPAAARVVAPQKPHLERGTTHRWGQRIAEQVGPRPLSQDVHHLRGRVV